VTHAEQQEMARLRADAAQLQALRVEYARLQQELGEVRAELARVVVQGAQMNERLAELLAIAQRKSSSRASKPAPARPPAPPVGDQAKEAFEARPTAPERTPEPPREKKKQRPTGRKPVPDHLPAEEYVVRPDACEHCGGQRARNSTDGLGQHQRPHDVAVPNQTTWRARTLSASASPRHRCRGPDGGTR
jgi:uncharacterized protein (DUF3084 family)